MDKKCIKLYKASIMMIKIVGGKIWTLPTEQDSIRVSYSFYPTNGNKVLQNVGDSPNVPSFTWISMSF